MRVYHLLAVAFVGMCLACGTPASKPATGKVWTESELLTVVKGKTKAEVIDLLGKPNSTIGERHDLFYYHNSIMNPYTNKVGTAVIEFEGDTAFKVRCI